MHPIQKIIASRSYSPAAGIYSCCSANEYVLRAAMQRAKKHTCYLLIEATANQVDQFGGYTGMTPYNFMEFVLDLAQEEAFPQEKLILGGDHLGPLTFCKENEADAMLHAEELVRQYVQAGFTKIHLDTSMKLASDNAASALAVTCVAQRGARLCAVCEKAYRDRKQKFPQAQAPVYIIGSEVPIPGGAQEQESAVQITTSEDAQTTLCSFKNAFLERGLADAWERVVGLVVQPGVEFGDDFVIEYNSACARQLTATLANNYRMVFEAHSTDYQTREALTQLVKDGYSILKVGPALTYALREALFSLQMIEEQLPAELLGTGTKSNFRAILEQQMIQYPEKWVCHYKGSNEKVAFDRAFSFSDRARYYLPNPPVANAVTQLLKNLTGCKIPYTVLSQYMPIQYKRVRNGDIKNEPVSLLTDRIGDCIDDYLAATGIIQ